jgi:hypothetical protein
MVSTGDYARHGQSYRVLRVAKGALSRQVRATDVTFIRQMGLRVVRQWFVLGDFVMR